MDNAKVLQRLDAMDARAKAAEMDPLKSTHIISPGYTHLANLTEVLTRDGRTIIGRGRCVAMIPSEWADYIADAVNFAPAATKLLRAALAELEGWRTYVVGPTPQERAATDAALAEFSQVDA